jgi:hypothetical protein
MKKIIFIIFATFLFQGTSLARQNGTNFEAKKSEIVQQIQAKRRILKTFENCVISSATPKILKSCKKQHKTAMQNYRKQSVQRRERLRAEQQRIRSGIRSSRGGSYEGS